MPIAQIRIRIYIHIYRHNVYPGLYKCIFVNTEIKGAPTFMEFTGNVSRSVIIYYKLSENFLNLFPTFCHAVQSLAQKKEEKKNKY